MSKKGENIYQRKDGRWEGRCILGRKSDGTYRYRYVYGDSYQEVKEKLIIEKSERILFSDKRPDKEPEMETAKGPARPANGVPVFRTFAEGWLAARQFRVKESTYIKYRNIVNSHILPELGDIEWSCFNREIMELFCQKMLSPNEKRRNGLSFKTVSDTMSVVRSIFRYGSEQGYGIPFDISAVFVRKETKKMRILSRKEQDRLCRFLLSELSDRNLGILICMFTGLRLGEICALRWDDISFSEQTIHIHRTMQRIQTDETSGRKTKIIITEPKSSGSIRSIPMSWELAKIIQQYGRRKRGYVLTGKENVYVEPRTMERYFEKILKTAGMEKVNFHVLRHTFATRCVEMDFDVKSLSEILGHSNVNITLNRYVHPSMELKRKNMQKLSELLAVS